MKVLVTGSEGYIGNRFITLKQGKHQISGCDLNPCKSSPVLEYFNFSFEDLEPKQLEGFDAVLHLAAISDDRTADADPRRCFQINWLATAELAKRCKEAGVKKFILASSASVYARPLGLDVGPLSESEPLRPQRVYALSKWLAEWAVLETIEWAVVLRQGTVYGLGERMRLDNVVVHTMMRDALFRQKIWLNNGRQWRPLIHLDDLIEVLDLALTELHPGVYNVAEGNYTIEDVALVVSQAFGVPIEVFERGTPWSYRMDYSRLIRFFEPKIGLVAGVLNMAKTLRRRLLGDAKGCGDWRKGTAWLGLNEGLGA